MPKLIKIDRGLTKLLKR